MSEYDDALYKILKALDANILSLEERVIDLERKIKELESTPKVINNYHNTYPQPQWVPSPYKYDITCSTLTGMEHAKST